MLESRQSGIEAELRLNHDKSNSPDEDRRLISEGKTAEEIVAYAHMWTILSAIKNNEYLEEGFSLDYLIVHGMNALVKAMDDFVSDRKTNEFKGFARVVVQRELREATESKEVRKIQVSLFEKFNAVADKKPSQITLPKGLYARAAKALEAVGVTSNQIDSLLAIDNGEVIIAEGNVGSATSLRVEQRIPEAEGGNPSLLLVFVTSSKKDISLEFTPNFERIRVGKNFVTERNYRAKKTLVYREQRRMCEAEVQGRIA